MSLIGDALKKARAERGSDLPANVYSVPVARRSSAPWIVAAASLSLAIGVFLDAAVFYRGGTVGEDPAGAEAPVEAPGAQQAAVPVPTPTAEAQAVGGTEPQLSSPTEGPSVTSDAEAPPSSSAAIEGATEVEAPAAGPETLEAESAAPGSSSDSDQGPTPPAPVQPRSVGPSPIAGQSYLKEVTLADGRSLLLNGIVWSDTSPAALINSEVYGVGEGAGPWTILKVERGEVQIQADGVEFILRLK